MSELPPPARRFSERRAAVVISRDTMPGEYPAVVVGSGEPVPQGVLATAIGLHGGDRVVVLLARPDWPALVELRSRRAGGGWWTVLGFAGPVDVADVLAEVERQPVWRSDDRPREPYDVRTINPTGFVPTADGPVVGLDDVPEVTPSAIDALRGNAAVRVDRWDDAAAHRVLGLALAGVPVVADDAPAPWSATTTAVDLADPTAREERSVVLRRTAFAMLAPVRQPAVSILLATRRAEMLDFALSQVARQRGVDDLELVLAPHGFDVDPARVRELLGPTIGLQVRPHPSDTLFGDVLHDAAQAAGGDVLLKMDDDDWYAPDVVTDLMLARRWSGAEMVGMPAELHYVAERDLTVKRGHPVELYAAFVAGGTMLVDRDALREAGGFRAVRKWVDAQLIDAFQQMGAAIYRTHGLGYVLRRNPTGHTWDVDLDYLLDPSRTVATWPGFRPSRLLEAEALR
ncbi:hypothetical protein ABFT23_03830 [Nocardioides sp. C4-1]|uniref:glycosyltransferase n=1 Tax=Nocardioides sp. C4-1 TaxID=3151851 RepID=UPI0032672CE3